MEWIQLGMVFVFGAIVGSFLNVVIYRVPRGENVAFPGSHCPHCGAPVKAWQNIPVVSWLLLRGKCHTCRAPISIQYPLIELVAGVIALVVFSKLGIAWVSAGVTTVFFLLLSLSVIDLYYKMVPDSLNLLALTVAIFCAGSFPMLAENFKNALLMAGGFALLRFYISYYLFLKLKKLSPNLKQASWVRNYNTIPRYVEAMGEGDIMIAATMGALLGIQLSLAAVFLSALLALPAMLLMRNETEESKRVPFIPFLAMATWIVYVFNTQVMSWIEGLYA